MSLYMFMNILCGKIMDKGSCTSDGSVTFYAYKLTFWKLKRMVWTLQLNGNRVEGSGKFTCIRAEHTNDWR